tara:strand:- start:2848 stop:3402 length:555 start_codon:yes stop_codon:yes gene_type:complete
MKKSKLHLGCGWRDFGSDWTHIDDGDYRHLDFKSNIIELPMIEDGSIDIIYASHVIAYFNRDEIRDVLEEWKRTLKVGGVLRIATPDFYCITKLYNDGKIDIEGIVGPLYGKMGMDGNIIYHKTTYDFESLKLVLRSCGFINVKLYDWRETEHSQHDDHSQSYIPHMDKNNGKLISLNIECIKV